MVHPQESRANWNERQRSIDERDAPPRTHGAPPHAGQVVGGRQSPPFEVNGLDALSPILMHVRFPTTKDEVIAAIGDARIPIDRVTTVPIRDVVARLGPERFASSLAFEAACKRIIHEMQPHYEDGRGARHK